MATRYRVTCTRKHEKHGHIISFGCYTPNGVFLSLTEAEVIANIEREDTFYVERPTGHVVELEVVTRHDGSKYVKTKPDKEKPDNLINLPDCPSSPPVVAPVAVGLGTVVGAANHGTQKWR